MPRIDNEKFYNSALDKHGITPKGLNWNSQKNQLLRFDAILKLLPKDLSSFKIADAGCGFGDFYFHLRSANRIPQEYIGIDSLQKMYNIASMKTKQKIIIADITKEEIPKADYYVCSGALNILTRFETHLFIQNCYKASKHGFIFNILYGDKESDTFNYFNTNSIKKLANDLEVNQWRQVKNYMKNDITIGFFK